MTLKQRIRSFRPKRKVNQVFFLHDNARPHNGGNCNNGMHCSPTTSLQFRFSTLQIQSFGPLQDSLRGRRFADGDDLLKQSLCEALRLFSKELYAIDVQRPMQRWKNCHSEDAVLRATTCWNKAYVRRSDTSAKSFTQSTCSFPCKDGKTVIPRTPFCGRRRRAETKPIWGAQTLQQRALRNRRAASHAKMEKVCWKWKRHCGKIISKCFNRCTNDIYNFFVIVIIFLRKKVCSLTFLTLLEYLADYWTFREWSTHTSI